MTEEELQAIESRANAATPGPWSIDHDWTLEVQATGALIGTVTVCKVPVQRGANAQFIASARIDVPQLVAKVRRLQAELEEASAFAMGNVHAVNELHEQLAKSRAEAAQLQVVDACRLKLVEQLSSDIARLASAPRYSTEAVDALLDHHVDEDDDRWPKGWLNERDRLLEAVRASREPKR